MKNLKIKESFEVKKGIRVQGMLDIGYPGALLHTFHLKWTDSRIRIIYKAFLEKVVNSGYFHDEAKFPGSILRCLQKFYRNEILVEDTTYNE